MLEPTPEQTAALNERHRVRMERKKAFIDAKIAAADKEIGVLIVNTGNGKGKSSSAFGMVARALGHGMKVGVVQFIKGAMATGAARKKAIVAVARQLAVDLWRIRTGRVRPETLGLKL